LAQNDDHYGLQSRLEVQVEPGWYRLRAGVCCGNPDAWWSGVQYDLEANVEAVVPTTSQTTTTIEETTVELWDQIMAVNLRGPFLMCRAAVPAMRAAGGGSIINVTSTNAYSGWSNLFAYSTSKGGLLVMTRNLSRGLARDRIRANALNPGWVISENEIAVQARDGHDLAWIEEAGRRQPLGRTQTPQDSAYAAVFLLSDESSQVTGTEMNVDAGRSMPGQGGSA
ncbi:MAG: SDR family oxidoreductase, partial [Proteobacteria bacterium]|nr:SDR family oxidoreductase [Pseudomonadota bacterium]